MSRGRQYIQFEGYFAESVFGIFHIIRGFADLWDLATGRIRKNKGQTPFLSFLFLLQCDRRKNGEVEIDILVIR